MYSMPQSIVTTLPEHVAGWKWVETEDEGAGEELGNFEGNGFRTRDLMGTPCSLADLKTPSYVKG